MKMTKTMAVKLEKAVIPINDHINKLNWGGCGVFAEHFFKMLANIGYSDISILVLEDYNMSPDYFQYNRELVLKYKRSNTSPRGIETANHYVVKCGDYIFDSTGICPQNDQRVTVTIDNGREERNYIVGEHSIEELEFMNKFQNLWNRIYNRKQNYLVEEFINNIPNKISKLKKA